MAATRRMSLNTGTPPKRKPRPVKEPGYKEAPKLNPSGSEYGAKRGGNRQQFDRASSSADKKVPNNPNVKGSSKSYMGTSEYPSMIDQARKGRDAAQVGSASRKGYEDQIKSREQAYENEKMGKVKQYYGKGRSASDASDGTYVKRTTKNADGSESTKMEVLNDKTYGATRRFQEKNKNYDRKDPNSKKYIADSVRSRKNLLGRTVTKTKTVQFGPETKGSGSKMKQVGDKVIKKTRTVQDRASGGSGIPLIVGKNARKYGEKSRSVSRVGTSTNKGKLAAGTGTRGVVTNQIIPVTYTGEDAKTKKFTSRKVVERSNSNRRSGKGLR